MILAHAVALEAGRTGCAGPHPVPALGTLAEPARPAALLVLGHCRTCSSSFVRSLWRSAAAQRITCESRAPCIRLPSWKCSSTVPGLQIRTHVGARKRGRDRMAPAVGLTCGQSGRQAALQQVGCSPLKGFTGAVGRGVVGLVGTFGFRLHCLRTVLGLVAQACQDSVDSMRASQVVGRRSRTAAADADRLHVVRGCIEKQR